MSERSTPWGPSTGQTREQVIENTMHPYSRPSRRGVDTNTMFGKVMCGYQGWFAAPGDGCGRGWYHWQGRHGFRPGDCTIDLWPDMTEMSPGERFVTEFRHRDGRPAEVFSSFHERTVRRHFEWMRQYGIDGVYVQRFVGETRSPQGLRHFTVVLNHCRASANRTGRAYALTYDLSGMPAHGADWVIEDWKLLIDRMQITRDPAYLKHNGRPVIELWGYGFNDNRAYSPASGIELVHFLKEDPRYGGNTVVLGVPSGWRTLDADCVSDADMPRLIDAADVVSPWTVGRYHNLDSLKRHAETRWLPDLIWCRQHDKMYLPVVFPGFSWHNMFPDSPLGAIPRLRGRFLSEQYRLLTDMGAEMVYQAMFDEVDEGTAIFKCTNDPPVGESRFLTYEGLPADHYLKLVGDATAVLRQHLKAQH